MAVVTELQINGKRLQVEAEADQTLLSVLRDRLDLTGAKYGCGEAQCGACTVLVNGSPTRSCVTPLAKVSGSEIITIEGLEQDGRLHPVQESFLKHDALQCGYCTPGMILSAVALLQRNPSPSRAEIVRAMDGNVCRCCIYPRILSAIEDAAAPARSPNP